MTGHVTYHMTTHNTLSDGEPVSLLTNKKLLALFRLFVRASVLCSRDLGHAQYRVPEALLGWNGGAMDKQLI